MKFFYCEYIFFHIVFCDEVCASWWMTQPSIDPPKVDSQSNALTTLRLMFAVAASRGVFDGHLGQMSS